MKVSPAFSPFSLDAAPLSLVPRLGLLSVRLLVVVARTRPWRSSIRRSRPSGARTRFSSRWWSVVVHSTSLHRLSRRSRPVETRLSRSPRRSCPGLRLRWLVDRIRPDSQRRTSGREVAAARPGRSSCGLAAGTTCVGRGRTAGVLRCSRLDVGSVTACQESAHRRRVSSAAAGKRREVESLRDRHGGPSQVDPAQASLGVRSSTRRTRQGGRKRFVRPVSRACSRGAA